MVVYGWLAVATALLHLAFVIALVGGAWVVYRHPAYARVHLLVVGAMTVVTVAGADCPFTVIENHLRRRAGWTTYQTGFISHYLIEPWHKAGITPSIRAAIIAIWIIPNVVAYGMIVQRARRRRDAL